MDSSERPPKGRSALREWPEIVLQKPYQWTTTEKERRRRTALEKLLARETKSAGATTKHNDKHDASDDRDGNGSKTAKATRIEA